MAAPSSGVGAGGVSAYPKISKVLFVENVGNIAIKLGI